MTIKDRSMSTATDQHERVTVVAADADPLARLGLRVLAQQAPDWRWLGYIEEARSVLLTVSRLRPQVLLLDSAWDQDGTLVQALYTHYPELNVVILSRPGHQRAEEYLRNARNAGAVATLPRDTKPDDLLADIRHAVADAAAPWARVS